MVLTFPIETRMSVSRSFVTGHSINCDSSLESLQCSEGVFERVLSCIWVRQQAAKDEV